MKVVFLEKFDNGHFWIKVKVTVDLPNCPQYKLSCRLTQLLYKLGSLN